MAEQHARNNEQRNDENARMGIVANNALQLIASQAQGGAFAPEAMPPPLAPAVAAPAGHGDDTMVGGGTVAPSAP
ncbi:MAG: hypothetical protein SGARI_003374, partial [Bacillariaceae sp.]